MDKYLIALDMDGTLLNSSLQIEKKTSSYLSYLEKQGHIVVIASSDRELNNANRKFKREKKNFKPAKEVKKVEKEGFFLGNPLLFQKKVLSLQPQTRANGLCSPADAAVLR